jgi:hypothetical protein
MWQPGSKVKRERLSQALKQSVEIVRIDEGMQIDCSDEHS